MSLIMNLDRSLRLSVCVPRAVSVRITVYGSRSRCLLKAPSFQIFPVVLMDTLMHAQFNANSNPNPSALEEWDHSLLLLKPLLVKNAHRVSLGFVADAILRCTDIRQATTREKAPEN